jgi:4-amino-4-deoxy-L-arabinose transferase-like glycosyltransferase
VTTTGASRWRTLATPRRSWLAPALVVALAGVVRLLYLVVFRSGYEAQSDAMHYHELAIGVADGDGLTALYPWVAPHPSAFRPPLYPTLLGGAYRVFGAEHLVGQLLNVALALGVVALCYHLVAGIVGRRAGLVAAGAVALYPPLVMGDAVPLSETLSALLLVATLLAAVRGRWAWCGVGVGLLVLTRPSAQFLVVVLAAYVWWRLGWRRALGVVALTALVVAPWIVRNQVQLGEPVYVTSNGFNLAALYSEEAQAAGKFVDPMDEGGFESSVYLRMDEVKWNAELQRLGLEGLRGNPDYAARVVGRNVLQYFELAPWENEVPERLDGRNMEVRDATLWTFYVVTAVGVFGLVVQRRRPEVVLFAAVAAYFVLSSLVLVSVPRLRSPFDLICCLGVGLAFAWWEARRHRPAPAPTGDPTDTHAGTPSPTA